MILIPESPLRGLDIFTSLKAVGQWICLSDDLSLQRAGDQTMKAGNCEVKLFFKDEDGDGFGSISKPYHAYEVPKGNDLNSDDEHDSVRKGH